MQLILFLYSCVFFTKLPTIYGWCFDFMKHRQFENGNECAHGGVNQSPIDIKIANAQRVNSTPLYWKNYQNVPKNMTLFNNGHSIQLRGEWNSEIPYLTSGPLNNSQYIFEQLHFHWGERNRIGSEHTIGGKSYSLEMHMVHWKRDYGSMANATNYADGIVVVAGLYEVSRKKPTCVLDNIFDSIQRVNMPSRNTNIKVFPLSNFGVVNIKRNYVTYAGSLTGPQCPEVVTWIIGLPIYTISNDQMEQLRSIELERGIENNNRPTQPLNNRTVYHVTRLRIGE